MNSKFVFEINPVARQNYLLNSSKTGEQKFWQIHCYKALLKKNVKCYFLL